MLAEVPEYPPTAAAQIAERIRANPDEPAPEGLQSLKHKRVPTRRYSAPVKLPGMEPDVPGGKGRPRHDSLRGASSQKNAASATQQSGYPSASVGQPPVATATGVGAEEVLRLPIAKLDEEEAAPLISAVSNIDDAPFLSTQGSQEAPLLLPIPSQQDAPPILPIANQREAPPMLPIPSQQEAPLLLPIPSQQEAPLLLPIPSQQEAPPLLPIPSQQGAPPLLPIPSQQETALLLPIPSQQETAPLLPIPSQQEAPPLLPIPSQQEEAPPLRGSLREFLQTDEDDPLMLPILAADQSPPMLPLWGLQDETPDSGISSIPLGIPFGQDERGQANPGMFLPISGSDGCDMNGLLQNQFRGSVGLPQDRKHFVTPTITTPLSSGVMQSGVMQSSRRPVPVPITSGILGSALCGSGVASGWGSGMTMMNASSLPIGNATSLPRWARSYTSTTQDDSTNNKSRSSTSPATDLTVNSSSIWASGASFKWAPEAFVQCWHRKLSETYQDYNMVNIVGEGRSAAVFIVQSKRNEKFFACKVLNKADQDMNTINSEIKALKRLDHPNIVRLYETNEDAESVFLIMELCLGGDLFARITDAGQLSENHSCIFAHQMLSALAYCHNVGFVHRDVKPENFLLETDAPDCLCLKLADFGIASSIRPANLDTTSRLGSGNWSCSGESNLPSFIASNQQSGSLPYMAPEILNGDWTSILKDVGASVRVFAASDLWSTGVVIYVMLSGCLPFGADSEMICSGHPPDFSAEVWSGTSQEAVCLILALVKPNLAERYSAKQALGHEWFKSVSASNFVQTPDSLHDDDGGVIRGELALALLEGLRRWRRTHKLRRIMITAIAKKLESNHDTNKVASTAFRIFSPNSAVLKSEDFVKEINAALGEESFSPKFTPSPLTTSLRSDWGSGSSANFAEDAKGRRWEDKHTFSGLHVRRRVRDTFKRLTRVNEEHASPVRGSAGSPGDELISLTELRLLASSLDTNKNGFVDYTVLVAALLAPEVYCEEKRIAEVFDLFDFQKRGKISPNDVRVFMGSTSDLKYFKEMVREFDLDGDGMLDRHEFQAMVRLDNKDRDSSPSPSSYSSMTGSIHKQ